MLRVGGFRGQTNPVVGDLAQRPGGGEVEDEAGGLEDQFLARVVPVGVLDRPWRLDAERGLEVSLGRVEVAQHEDRRPLLDRHPGRQLPARQSDRLCVVPIFDRLAYRRQRIQSDASVGAGDGEHCVVVPVHVLSLGQQVLHGLAGRNCGQEPE